MFPKLKDVCGNKNLLIFSQKPIHSNLKKYSKQHFVEISGVFSRATAITKWTHAPPRGWTWSANHGMGDENRLWQIIPFSAHNHDCNGTLKAIRTPMNTIPQSPLWAGEEKGRHQLRTRFGHPVLYLFTNRSGLCICLVLNQIDSERRIRRCCLHNLLWTGRRGSFPLKGRRMVDKRWKRVHLTVSNSRFRWTHVDIWSESLIEPVFRCFIPYLFSAFQNVPEIDPLFAQYLTTCVFYSLKKLKGTLELLRNYPSFWLSWATKSYALNSHWKISPLSLPIDSDTPFIFFSRRRPNRTTLQVDVEILAWSDGDP